MMNNGSTKTTDIYALPCEAVNTPTLSCSQKDLSPWIPIIATPASFPVEIFHLVCDEIVLHPERNSSSILRCDVLSEDITSAAAQHLSFDGFRLTKYLRRKILPRRPFDATLEQDCYFFQSSTPQEPGDRDALVVLVPLFSSRTEEAVPFYHPKVAGIAFRYIHSSDQPLLQIDFVPLESLSLDYSLDARKPYYPENSRTYRTALNLLTMLNKHGKGRNKAQAYQKRVYHDTIVPREEFQDLYLVLKEKYAWIINEWKENTDPVKHVFEDVAIMTFLICLWKQMYTDGRPPGGFVDVGCGNGLLVYLLVKEGYSGYGFDLRARKSWALWGAETPLRTTTLSPVNLCLASDDARPFPVGSFLIGNHCDELTPWIPLLAALTPDSGFINIPCCFHTFDGRFTKGNHVFPPELLEDPIVKADYERSEALQLEKGGRYNAFMSYMAEITVRAGWRLEREALRIPSTKCWAFVGRNRRYGPEEVEKLDEVREWIREIANDAKKAWKPRKPEGKDH